MDKGRENIITSHLSFFDDFSFPADTFFSNSRVSLSAPNAVIQVEISVGVRSDPPKLSLFFRHSDKGSKIGFDCNRPGKRESCVLFFRVVYGCNSLSFRTR